MMKKVYVMVGLPGTGKSTYIKNNLKDLFVASSDDYIQLKADLAGATYNEMFQSCVDEATSVFNRLIKMATVANIDFVIDRTNLTVKTRSQILKKIPDSYSKIAVHIHTPSDYNEWLRRLNRPGKLIPNHVISNMINNYEPPHISEGFDEIITVEQ